jgi:hypothetical protein
MSGLGAEIIAIDDTDRVGWVEGATTIGEVVFQTPQTFVNNVLAALGSRRMSLLHVQVHGSPDAVWFGSHRVDTNTIEALRATFERLTPKFESDAWVDMRACNVGQNLALLHKFRRMWNVGIVAGRGRQNNLFDANFGLYQIVTRDGQESTSFRVPPWVEYSVSRRLSRSITSRIL